MHEATQDQIKAVAYITHGIRPDWDRPGIEAVLSRIQGATLAQITHAATVAAATRTDQRTPAIIAAKGAHWDGCLERPVVRPVSLTERLRNEPPTTPATPETIKAMRQRLRERKPHND